MEWISVEDRLPEKQQRVAFVVDNKNDYYDNEVLGGKYQGDDYGYPAFSVPGITFKGKFWYPLEEPPKMTKKLKHGYCVGYADKEGKCKSTNNTKYESEYWCDECEHVRRDIITQQFEELICVEKADGC